MDYKITLDQKNSVYNLFNRFWHMVQNTYNFDGSDEYWDALLAAGQNLTNMEKRGEDYELMSRLVNAYLSYQQWRLEEAAKDDR